ncbi:TRAP-type C4-dicarboxylate transport system substrate-binding protein [Paenochrobactrum gallinarii]|uniref:TRAP-type C4-dicarboxylate transport system substrate-binding protein n=1 Tax=Paenochrobactrum gallinarii TaxID=643673 RepID=A0A841M8J1_9HYPH|nr:TRAP transporter substrate-binding protein [Paenochrobactrum gallinarii]MBB6262551.1 TRAP-type C4-dicarboxylate transport system substrate-binding protein [Paenochrobactrum gallinarii]
MFKTLFMTASIFALTTGLGIAQEKPLTLTISAFSTSSSGNHRLTIDRFVKEIEEDSDGKVKFETYFGGTAYGNPQRQFDQAQRGLVDIAHGMFGYTPGRFPMADLIELPFLYEDSVAASRAFWLSYDKYLRNSMPGVRPIAIWLTSMQQLHTRKPVAKIDDLAGLKIRAGGSIMVDTLGNFNGEGVLTPAPAIYEMMEKGVLDGAVGAWGMLKAFNVGEVSSDHLELNITAAPLFLLMNEAKYNALPDDVKALIDRYSTPENIARFAEAFVKSDAAGYEIAKGAGHAINELSEADRATWKARAQPVIDANIAALEAKGFPAKAFVADFEAEYQRQLAAPKSAN